MWNLPGPGVELYSLCCQVDSYPLRHQGSPVFFFFFFVAAGDGGIKYILVIIEPGSPCRKVFTAEVIAEENVSCSVCRFQGVTGSCQEGTPGCSGLGRALWGSMGIQLCSSSPATWYLLIHVLGSEQG